MLNINLLDQHRLFFFLTGPLFQKFKVQVAHIFSLAVVQRIIFYFFTLCECRQTLFLLLLFESLDFRWQMKIFFKYYTTMY